MECINGKTIGADWAKGFADAHEFGFEGNLGLNTQMDLYNNSIGRNLGVYNQDKENWEIAGVVQEYVKNGWLYRIKDGVLTPKNSDYR